MCKRGDRYRNANGFFLVKRRFTGFCGTAGRSAYGQAGSCLTAAEKTEIDWADRIRSDKRKADLHLTIHFIQWEIEFQSRTSGWRIRMLDCFEFYIFTSDYVLGGPSITTVTSRISSCVIALQISSRKWLKSA